MLINESLIFNKAGFDKPVFFCFLGVMVRNKEPSFILVGLSLFSMFFGSGNLIFPLMLGRDAGSAFLISAFGFTLTAVLIPCFGILAITLAQGNYENIFNRIFLKKIALFFIFFILLSFIPFGAAPRCVVLAHASLNTFLSMPPLWIFSLAFLIITGYLVNNRLYLLAILGKFLTPILLFLVAMMVASALINGEIAPPIKSSFVLFKESIFQGYNTQDLLSSLFFSSSLIMLIKSHSQNKENTILIMLKGSLLCIALLTVIYLILIAAAALHSDILRDFSGIDLVSVLAKHTLGQDLGFLAGMAVAIACLTTLVALIMAFSQFLQTHILKPKINRFAIPISLAMVFSTSLLKFEGIMTIISPLMKIIYPMTLLVIGRYLLLLWQEQRYLKANFRPRNLS